MISRARLRRLERETALELQQEEQRRLQRDRKLQKDLRLPLPELATELERKEAFQRLLKLQAAVRAAALGGKSYDDEFENWLRWVNSIHRKYDPTIN